MRIEKSVLKFAIKYRTLYCSQTKQIPSIHARCKSLPVPKEVLRVCPVPLIPGGWVGRRTEIIYRGR